MLVQCIRSYNGSPAQTLHEMSPIIVENTVDMAVISSHFNNEPLLWVLSSVPDSMSLKMLRNIRTDQNVFPVVKGVKRVNSPNDDGSNVLRSFSIAEVNRLKLAKSIYVN